LIILCGISGGFSGVFGTPFAAAIFAIEAPAIGRLRISALAHCFVAAVCAHLTVQLLSVEHAHYAIASRMPGISLIVLVKILIAAVAFGLAAAAFVELTRAIERVGHRFAANPIARASLGGVVIVAVTIALGTREYNGLSLPMLARSLSGGDVPDLAFMIKLGLTALTLGVGFKGGEVTPLFVIGATLGVTLSGLLNLPSDALAAIGFVSVFAAASNTPVACVIMAIELFGADGALFYAVSIAVAYVASGHRGIYASQRMHRSKVGVRLLDANMTLRDAPPLAVRARATEVVRRIRVR
jgi:H+/Cl- antiporter ClcA